MNNLTSYSSEWFLGENINMHYNPELMDQKYNQLFKKIYNVD